MEGDYLELSQIPYNPHLFPYNSHQSPLGTTGFLTERERERERESSCKQPIHGNILLLPLCSHIELKMIFLYVNWIKIIYWRFKLNGFQVCNYSLSLSFIFGI